MVETFAQNFPVLTDLFEHGRPIHGLWDSRRERFSLGGLLLLRQELEQLAQSFATEDLILHITGAADLAKTSLLDHVLSSKYRFEISSSPPPAKVWPPSSLMEHPVFSYQFFDRVAGIFRQTGNKPKLLWSAKALDEASSVRLRFPGALYAIHLKNIPGKTIFDSNADMESWYSFFSAHAKPGDADFILLGTDAVSSKILGLPGVHSATAMKLALSVQLALVPLCNGFLGMASGVSPAAILSDTPYVLFKHPRHHVEEMQRELGTTEHFCFAHARQKVWRMVDSPDNLEQAFAALSA